MGEQVLIMTEVKKYALEIVQFLDSGNDKKESFGCL